MSKKIPKLNLLLVLCFIFCGTKAQESLVSTGATIKGSTGNVSYSVGQTFFCAKTGTNSSDSYSQGVQQAYVISVPTNSKTGNNYSLSYTVHPNPTTGILNLKVKKLGKGKTKAVLYDPCGKNLKNIQVTESETIVNMVSLPKGTYFLKIFEETKEIKMFKIIKN